MDSKIRIKLGPIEVEYEGSEGFLKQDLPELIKTVTELSRTANMQSSEGSGGGSLGDNQKLELSTASIATKLGCKSGPELIVAAAAHLTLAKGMAVFTRKDLLKEMKTATSFYKASYNANLTSLLKTLLKDSLNEPSSGKYALTEAKKKEVRTKLV